MKTLTRDQAIYAARQAAIRAGKLSAAYAVSTDGPAWTPEEWVIDAILTATESGEIQWVVTEHEGLTEVSGERYGMKVIGRFDAASTDAPAAEYQIRRIIFNRLSAQRPTDEGGTYWIRRIAVGGGIIKMHPHDNDTLTVLTHRAEGAPAPGA